ncbi:N-acyl-phosphatidylethanolamine-hydrolyzing phospholipase D, partial [Lachnellula suecica]
MKRFTTFYSSKSTSETPAHHTNSGFKNPWPSADPPTWSELLSTKFPLGWYNDLAKRHPNVHDVKVIVPDWGKSVLKQRGLEREKCIIGTPLGHAGALTEMRVNGKSYWALYDPIFSMRAGPTQYTGPMRMKPSPCQVTDLPGCDAVIISHNHYDHLDLGTIQALIKNFPKAKYFVPLGNKSWLLSLGVSTENVIELDWWQDRSFSASELGLPAAKEADTETRLKFTCVPAQHNSGRGALDQGQTLWSGWVIEHLLITNDESSPTTMRRRGAIFHAGDTGYRRTAKSEAVCPVFAEIGRKFGFFDLAFVPIWRGGSLSWISKLGLRLDHNDVPSALHASPVDAVDIH